MGLEELEKIARQIKEKRILVQLPAGLMNKVVEIKQILEGKEVFFSSHPCFGACDVHEFAALKIGAQAIINIGHSELRVDTRVPVYFIEWTLPFPDIPEIGGVPKKIGLVTTVQYVKKLDEIQQAFEDRGHEVFVGLPGEICKYRGQVSGCDTRSALSIADEVEGFVFIGTSCFHSLKVAADSQKPVWVVHDTGKVEKINDEEVKRELKKRAARKALAKSHNKYGLLVSTKAGQFRQKQAEELKNKLEQDGKIAVIIVGNIFRSEEIGNFNVDAFVTTACPRLVDDYEAFGKPIYSLEDF